MLSNYWKVAIRYLLRNKGYSIINILGLTIGIACCVLIMLFVKSEWTYDRFHSKAERIFRLWQYEKGADQEYINTVTPLSAASVIQESYPEVSSTCRVYSFNPIIKVGASAFTDAVRMVDSSFFNVFDFKLIDGNKAEPFPTDNSVLLTQETARKYFGRRNPVGEKVEMQLGTEKILFTVAGITMRPPENSSVKFNLLIPYGNAKFLFSTGAFRSWTNVQSETYIMLKRGVNASDLEKKFTPMIKNYLGEDYREGAFLFHLQPITDIHLNTDLPAGNEPTSNPKYSYILGTIGILILLVACINFIMLSIGRSSTRALEVGVRKVMGAVKRQLIRQFWGEAILLTIVSVTAGLMVSVALLKPFNAIVQRQLSINFDPWFILFCLGMIMMIALIAGMYPAFILSGFRPAEVLKGKLRMKGRMGWLRQGMIVGQFVTSIAMIICTIAVGKQMHFLQHKDLGYRKDQVVVVSTNQPPSLGLPLANNYRIALLKQPQVISASVSIYSLAETPWLELGYTDELRKYKGFQYNAVDPHFIQTMGLRMVEGRAFSADNLADISNAAVVNEAYVKAFELKNPVGKKLPGPFDQQIIGVVEDFNFRSLHTKVEPLLLTVKADSIVRRTENISYEIPPQPRISVLLKNRNLSQSVEVLRKAWKAVAPGQEFDFHFVDESIASQYKSELRTNRIVKIASGLSIFIACMGLLGLATLTVTRRTKEIGIRKVLGANAGSIVALLSIEFVRLIVIAALIAFPLAGWFMNDWLKDFAYRTQMSWWVYLVAAFVALIVALATIASQALKAAWKNPVRSLRTE